MRVSFGGNIRISAWGASSVSRAGMSRSTINTIPEEPEDLSNSENTYDTALLDHIHNADVPQEGPPRIVRSVESIDSSIMNEDTEDTQRAYNNDAPLEGISLSEMDEVSEIQEDTLATSEQGDADKEGPACTLSHDIFGRHVDKTPCDVCKFFRVIGSEFYQNHAQEPWPKDVRLFQPYEVEQILLPDNANCLAVQTYLKMCGLEYQVDARPNAEAMSPTGKVPFIKCGAFVVSELEGIVQFAANKGISLTQELTNESKSDMRAYMTLVNNVLGNAELYICWCDPETYNEVTKPRYGSIYPWPLNHLQTWSKRREEVKRLKILGWYQKTLDEVYSEVETCCQALTDRLDGNDYFYGSKPTEMEALMFGHLYTILTTPMPNAVLANTVKNFPELINLITRLEKQYFQRETQH